MAVFSETSVGGGLADRAARAAPLQIVIPPFNGTQQIAQTQPIELHGDSLVLALGGDNRHACFQRIEETSAQ